MGSHSLHGAAHRHSIVPHTWEAPSSFDTLGKCVAYEKEQELRPSQRDKNDTPATGSTMNVIS